MAGVLALGEGLLDLGKIAGVLFFGETLLDFLPVFGVDIGCSADFDGVDETTGVLVFGDPLRDFLPDFGVAIDSLTDFEGLLSGTGETALGVFALGETLLDFLSDFGVDTILAALTGVVITGDLAFGEALLGDLALGEALLGDLAFGEAFLGDLASGEALIGDLALGEALLGDLALGEALLGDLALGDFDLGEVDLGDLPFGEVLLEFRDDVVLASSWGISEGDTTGVLTLGVVLLLGDTDLGDRALGEAVRSFGEVLLDFLLDLGVATAGVLGVGDTLLDFLPDLGVLAGVTVGVFIPRFFLAGDFAIDTGVFPTVAGVFFGDCTLDLGVVLVFDKPTLGVELLFGLLLRGVLFIFWGDEGGFCNGVSTFVSIFIYKKCQSFLNRKIFSGILNLMIHVSTTILT